ncbi:MAG: hypothetical protein ACOCRK_10310 [bacterium]
MTYNKYYNKALDNSKEWFYKRLEDIESNFYVMYKLIKLYSLIFEEKFR